MDLFADVSTVDTGARAEWDFYPTPPFMTRSLLHFHPAIEGATVLEPCSGDGAIVRVLEERGCRVFTNDIDIRHPSMTHYDAAQPWYWREHAPKADWIVSNLPFNVGIDILRCAYEHAEIGLALLFRKTFLEPTDDRGPWLSTHPPTRCIGQPRYSFRGTGSDSVSCDWYIWERRPDRTLPPFVIDYAAERRTR